MTHPLYPEKDKDSIGYICLYEIKPCMMCSKYSEDVEWKTVVESDAGMWSMGGQYESKFIRVCGRCFNINSSQF